MDKQHRRQAPTQAAAAAAAAAAPRLQVLDSNTKRLIRVDAHFDNPARYFFHLHVKAGDQLWRQCVTPTDPEHGPLAWLGATILHYHVRMEVSRRSPPPPHSDSPKALSAAAAAYTGPDALAELDAHFHLRAWRQALQPDAWRLGPLRLASVVLACLGAAHRLHGGELDQALVVGMMDVMDGEAVPGVRCCRSQTQVRGWLWNTAAPPLCCHPGVPAEPTAPYPSPARALQHHITGRQLQHTVSLPANPSPSSSSAPLVVPPAAGAGRGQTAPPAAAVAAGAQDHWSGWNVVNTQLQDDGCSAGCGPHRVSDATSESYDSEEAGAEGGGRVGPQGPPEASDSEHIAPIIHKSVSVVASRSMVGRAMIRGHGLPE